jgi:alpha-beta hydrolase superfamily lysophospholipase
MVVGLAPPPSAKRNIVPVVGMTWFGVEAEHPSNGTTRSRRVPTTTTHVGAPDSKDDRVARALHHAAVSEIPKVVGPRLPSLGRICVCRLSPVSATPVWFGSKDRPCFGWLHVPAGDSARAGVVICPPAGYEYISSHRTLRTLAERLAARGLVALRFDYDGTGDSAGGDKDPDRLSAWLTTITDARNLVCSTGVPLVAAVGMRLGATLAATAAGSEDSPFNAVVLWDPVWSGRTMMRQLRALHQVGVAVDGEGDAGDGSLEVAGVRYSAQTIAQLGDLRFPDLSSTALPTLVLTRPHDPVRAPADRLPAGGTWIDAVGQEELLDRESSISIVPEATLEVAVDWLEAQFSSAAVPVNPPQSTTTVMPGGVTERAVRFGPDGLFGIVAEGDVVPGRPTLVLLNNASDHHIGPNRMWVDWGRRMASLGFRVARVDISGIGDSPTRSGRFEDRSYPATRNQDVAEICTGIDDGNGVVLIGLCSGGRIAIDSGPEVGARGVVAINVAMHTPTDGLELMSHEDPSPPIVAAAWKWHPIRHHLYIRFPKNVWRLLDATGIVPSPCRPVMLLADSGADVLLIWGAGEYGLQRTREKARWALDELTRRPGCRVVVVAGLDHALMRGAERDAQGEMITTHLMTTFTSDQAQTFSETGQRRS